MRNAMGMQFARFALVIGCLLCPWAHGAEPVTSVQSAAQPSSEGTPAPMAAGAARSGPKLRPAAPAPSVKPGAVLGARAYVPRRPEVAELTRRQGAAAALPRGWGNTTTLPTAANRPSPAAVFGNVARSPAGLRPASGGGVIGGPRMSGSAVVGGPPNHRTVIKAGIDGSAVHRRS